MFLSVFRVTFEAQKKRNKHFSISNLKEIVEKKGKSSFVCCPKVKVAISRHRNFPSCSRDAIQSSSSYTVCVGGNPATAISYRLGDSENCSYFRSRDGYSYSLNMSTANSIGWHPPNSKENFPFIRIFCLRLS